MLFRIFAPSKRIKLYKLDKDMNKFTTIAMIASLVVADLVLSGTNILLGLALIGGGLGTAMLMDEASRKPRHTTSITKAARQQATRQQTQLI